MHNVVLRNETRCDSSLLVPCSYHVEAAEMIRRLRFPEYQHEAFCIAIRAYKGELISLSEEMVQRYLPAPLCCDPCQLAISIIGPNNGIECSIYSNYQHVYFAHETSRHKIIYMHFNVIADIHLRSKQQDRSAIAYIEILQGRYRE